MNRKDILTARLHNQQLTFSNNKSVKDTVAYMGALQAQDPAMAKWAIGARLPGSTEKSVIDALDRGEILRTHLLRPTWHLVSADDIYWMIELTAPQINAIAKNRYKELGLSKSVFKKSNGILQKAMKDGNHPTREELVSLYKKAKIALDNNRLSHLLLYAETDGLICSGPYKNKKQTYALLAKRVPQTRSITREKALEMLAEKYFTSRGPATLADFTWWSGLSVTDARKALEMAAPKLSNETLSSQQYWFPISTTHQEKTNAVVQLLPSFDEFVIGYKDRSAFLPVEHHRHAVSDNGIFRPVILVNGKVTGLWSRELKNNHAIIKTNFFEPQSSAVKTKVGKAIKTFGKFLDVDTTWLKE